MKIIPKSLRCIGLIFLGHFILLFVLFQQTPCRSNIQQRNMTVRKSTYTKVIPYHRNMALTFIGGVPRSGTTLMRAMLDAHPDVRCGEETHIIPILLALRQKSLSSIEPNLFSNFNEERTDLAFASFILEIMALHGEAAPHLCNKDPLTHLHIQYLKRIFPNAKFILMIRDGRATVHSIFSRGVSVTGFTNKDFRQDLSEWNSVIENMYSGCRHVGKDSCMLVHYEQLVLQPKIWMEQILKFLKISWHSSVLHHEDFINKPKGVSISRTEFSSDQVIRPVNVDALYDWVGNIPDEVIQDIASIAPMLKILGYDPETKVPNYGKPDPKVLQKTYEIRQNASYWIMKEHELREHQREIIN